MEEPFIDVENNEVKPDIESVFERMEVEMNDPLSEEERHYLITGDVLNRAIKQDELAIQKARLKELKELFELVKELNANVHADQETLDKIHKAVDHTVNGHIQAGKHDLVAAQKHKDALRRKQRIFFVLLGVAIIIAGLIVYFKIIKN
eukprot:TRINITY_DN5378_c0_g1_i2.p2 TRINITY_DN5378_c0_g1~~TRINITY_DN5378_c0_g1_i2.p2  ORF type:complete len:148 (+),score=51.39 TRINITY_DN5378_c0_g1_i2:208-651(+)